MRNLLEIVSGIWQKRTVVKNVCNVVIKVIDSLDGEIDWKQQN